MKRPRLILLSCLLFVAAQAKAAPVTWELSNVVFADGAKAEGTLTSSGFDLNLTTWDITVSGGDINYFTPFRYDTTHSSYSYTAVGGASGAPYVAFYATCCQDSFLKLILPDFSLPASGGIVNLGTATSPVSYMGLNWISVQDNQKTVFDSRQRSLISGSLVAVQEPFAVPEPTTLLLVGSGLAAVALRRKKATR